MDLFKVHLFKRSEQRYPRHKPPYNIAFSLHGVQTTPVYEVVFVEHRQQMRHWVRSDPGVGLGLPHAREALYHPAQAVVGVHSILKCKRKKSRSKVKKIN